MFKPRLIFLIIFLCCVSISINGLASDNGRKALLIGNAAYPSGKLVTPPADARRLTRMLRSYGFSVKLIQDADLRQMEKAVNDFVKSIEESDIAFFYYSGHAIQLNGKNYLTPVDAAYESGHDIPYMAFSVDTLLEKLLDSPAGLGIVMLEANRKHEFTDLEGVKTGLAEVKTPPETIFAMAAQPGEVIDERESGGSLFTSRFMSMSRYRNLSIYNIFRMAQAKTRQTSINKQNPWIAGKASDKYYFIAEKPAAIGKDHIRPNVQSDLRDRLLKKSKIVNKSRVPKSANVSVGKMPTNQKQPTGAAGIKIKNSKIGGGKIVNKSNVKNSTNIAIGKGSKPKPPPPPPPPAPAPASAPAPAPAPEPEPVSDVQPESDDIAPAPEAAPEPAAVEPAPVAPVAPAQAAESKPEEKPEPRGAVEKYPTMECPDQVKAENEFAVMVSLTDDLISPEVKVKTGKTTEDGKLVLDLPDEKNMWEIQVILSAPGMNFAKGSNIGKIKLPRDGDSTPALFYLASKKRPEQNKDYKIFATFWYEGAFLAKIMKKVTVLGEKPASAQPEPAKKKKTIQTADKKTKNVAQSNSTDIRLSAKTADLTIYLLEGLNPDNPKQAQMIISSPHLPPSVQIHETSTELSLWLGLQYDKLMRRSAKLQEARIRGTSSGGAKTRAEAVLRGFGRELYKKCAPDGFKKAFWKVHDLLGAEFKTIQIYSNNPVIPWELMKPVRPDGSAEKEFLGLEFQVGRWHVNQDTQQLERPPQKLPMKELVVIAPKYEGKMDLPGIMEEIKALQSISGYRKVTGSFDELEDLLADLPDGIVHFSGHGQVKASAQGPSLYVIGLEDGYLDSMTWRGLVNFKNKGPHPFFFFNACKVGQAHKVAGFVDGWAPAMLEAGAAGFIGALWPVDDQGAVELSKRFYKSLNDGLNHGSVNVAEVFINARKKLYLETGNPTYMAYVYFGDPNLAFYRK